MIDYIFVLFSENKHDDDDEDDPADPSWQLQGGPKKRGHSVLQKYCSDLHSFFAEIKVV